MVTNFDPGYTLLEYENVNLEFLSALPVFIESDWVSISEHASYSERRYTDSTNPRWYFHEVYFAGNNPHSGPSQVMFHPEEMLWHVVENSNFLSDTERIVDNLTLNKEE